MLQLFLAGSASGVTVTVGGLVVLLTVRTAAFHTPHTRVGAMPLLPPCCQSPARLEAPFTVRSVRNSAGHNGRPPPAATSVPARSPVNAVVPTCGFDTHVALAGLGVMAKSVVVVAVLVLTITRRTPSVSACSSLYHSLMVVPVVAQELPPGLEARSTPL